MKNQTIQKKNISATRKTMGIWSIERFSTNVYQRLTDLTGIFVEIICKYSKTQYLSRVILMVSLFFQLTRSTFPKKTGPPYSVEILEHVLVHRLFWVSPNKMWKGHLGGWNSIKIRLVMGTGWFEKGFISRTVLEQSSYIHSKSSTGWCFRSLSEPHCVQPKNGRIATHTLKVW